MEQQPPKASGVSRPTGNRKMLSLVGVVLAAVVIGAGAGAYYYVSHGDQSGFHVANASLAEVEHASGSNMKRANSSYVPPKNYSTTDWLVTEYVNTFNGSDNPSGAVLLVSLGFVSQSEAYSFYSSVYSTESSYFRSLNSTLVNGTYGGFSYFTATLDHNATYFSSVLYEYIAVGHAGRFVFLIIDEDLELSNSDVLLHDQINAMAS